MTANTPDKLKSVEFFSQRAVGQVSSLWHKEAFVHQPESAKQASIDALNEEQRDPSLLRQSQLKRTGKFIQVVLLEEHFQQELDILAFMPFIHEKFWYHATILKELLFRLHIDGGFPEVKQHLDNYEYCEFDAQVIDVLGGGYYEIDETTLLLTLSGKSTAYGRYRKHRLLDKFNANGHLFSDYQLVFF